MKSFFSRVVNSWKRQRLPRSDVDCSDFVRVRPDAPCVARLRQVVQERRFGAENGGAPSPAANSSEALHREASVRSTVFDLRYRCGGAGRCVENDYRCRFPCCFAMRPVTKGAEVLAERLAYEVDDAPTPQIRALVQMARDEKLEAVIQGIQALVNAQIREVAGGRELLAALQPSQREQQEQQLGVDDFNPAAPKYGRGSVAEGVNPLLEDASLRREVVALYLWRAALLVNVREDERAVSSLLNLAALVPQEDRERLYTSAAAWAALNDMEIVYYRSLLQQYEAFPEAMTFAHDRPLLLKRVFEACGETAYFLECATHIVFSKEVTATVSRAQGAQMYGDFTEDPMKSLCIPLSLQYYRFCVSDAFWEHFMRLLCMPPIPAPNTPEERARDPGEQLGLTPNYMLDAIGRSMMLHHLVMLHEAREREIASGAIVDVVKQKKAQGGEGSVVHPLHYEHVLNDRERGIAITRLRELLFLARSYRNPQRPLDGDDSDGVGEKGQIAPKADSAAAAAAAAVTDNGQ
ncbi:hypothetical protein C3747_36g164 [Trypanosoma cruzi]|uniref:Uncharacterized protein n=2 Tax=Trypanosoma cruzi TaxID=5693 RepID=Q4D3E5_TRYCC|nr:hypothetical protein, conserved [Trypanosoma cruzi]EAN87041.1 hypothetical protein, conserved [Trypanosoma cruzi]PWV14428.1 hypothetical protein C3747_36g164 [Trypanosoma cruzi]|eukprot:XP_808892.1 hypothetical protein [Trypanosoma cruzi strain CL Brener]